MGIFNSNIFGKKDNDQKNYALDPQSQQLIEEAPLESMHNDLNPKKETPVKEIAQENPFKNDLPVAPQKPSPKEKKSTLFQPETLEMTTPFFSPKNNPQPITQNLSNNQKSAGFNPENKNIEKKEVVNKPETEKLPEEKKSSGKVLAFIFTLLIILALAGGGYYYYFFILKKAPIEEIGNSSTVIPEIEPIENNISEEKLKPRYLNLDIQNQISILSSFKNTINDFVSKKETSIAEYIISDSQNNPVSFQEIIQKTGTTLPKPILSLLGNDFRFFLYDDNSNPGVGIVFNSLNDNQLEQEFLKLEPSLLFYLKPLYSMTQSDLTDKKVVFEENSYKGIKNRYYNIRSPKELSFDYMISNGKLFIGTTQMTIRAIYDLIEKESLENKDLTTQNSTETAIFQENETLTNQVIIPLSEISQ